MRVLRYILYIRFYVNKGVEGELPENKRIGFIGGGNMAGAIIDAILTSRIVAPDRLAVFDTSADKRGFFCEKGQRIAASNQERVE